MDGVTALYFLIDCLFPTCTKSISVFYKQYPACYKLRKSVEANKTKRLRRPNWYLNGFKTHILGHINKNKNHNHENAVVEANVLLETAVDDHVVQNIPHVQEIPQEISQGSPQEIISVQENQNVQEKTRSVDIILAGKRNRRVVSYKI